MDETSEVIRQEMDETKSQLSAKLDTLESQFSEVVQSTGAAVSETAASVQQSFSSVAETIQDGMQSVNDAFDIPRHVRRHPWLALGGAFAIGYLAYEFFNEPCAGSPTAGGQGDTSDDTAAIGSAHAFRSQSSPIGEFKGALEGALMGAMYALVSSGVRVAIKSLTSAMSGDEARAPQLARSVSEES